MALIILIHHKGGSIFGGLPPVESGEGFLFYSDPLLLDNEGGSDNRRVDLEEKERPQEPVWPGFGTLDLEMVLKLITPVYRDGLGCWRFFRCWRVQLFSPDT